MKSCWPAGASVLIRSSLPAMQLAGVCELSKARTGSVAPAPLKSCVPAVNVLDAASLASPALRLLIVVCRLLTSDWRAAVSALILVARAASADWRAEPSLSMLLCNVVSADWRALVSDVNADVVATFVDEIPPMLEAFTLNKAEPSPVNARAVTPPRTLTSPVLKMVNTSSTKLFAVRITGPVLWNAAALWFWLYAYNAEGAPPLSLTWSGASRNWLEVVFTATFCKLAVVPLSVPLMV